MKTLPWFRMYSEARTDNKLRTLADDEHRVWFNLLCLAAEQGERGTISGQEPFLLAVEVANGDEDLLECTVGKLVRLRIVRRGEDGAIAFINFGARNHDKPSDLPDATRERKARQRERERASAQGHAPITHESRDVTPNHAQEESREEEKREEIEPTARGDAAAATEDRSDGLVYALVDAFAEGKGLKRTDIAGSARQKAFRSLQSAPPWATAEDVSGCTAYLMSDPFWQEPGKLQPQKVVEVLPEWRTKGKPKRFAPTAPVNRNGATKAPSSGVVSRADGDRQRQLIGR